MLESINLWFQTTAVGEFLWTMLVSMVPVIELRGGLPIGVAMGLPLWVAFVAAVIGNMMPVPFIILFVRRVFFWIRQKLPRLHHFIDKLERRAEDKQELILKYKTWGLLILVAIPLPGTGAWTGALVAALMDLRMKKALPAIFGGVVVAGLIISVITYGVTAL